MTASNQNIDTTPKITKWITASDGNGSCVEVRRNGVQVEVRDTKNRAAGVQTYTLTEWAVFEEGVRSGVFSSILS